MDMEDLRDKLTITRRFPNGAVTAMIVYRASGIIEWTIVVFPDIQIAEAFAISAQMDFAINPEVQLQMRALNEALESPGGG
jgi:hypothetical protein